MSEFLSQGLDYYKATMGQLEFEQHPDAEVTFALKNRSPERPLSDYLTPAMVSERLAELERGWQPEELAYLAGLQNQDGDAQFSAEYLDFLASNDLPPVHVDYDETGEIAVNVTGPWPLVTFWETVVMSEMNELYFREKLTREGTDLEALYHEGDQRLDDKIARLRDRPDIKFSDFGTRRRFSYAWQKHVIERIANELPDNFVGTSNIYLAHELGLKPIGTFAHELPMVYCALEDEAGNDPLDGHNRVLQDWQRLYRGDLSTALTDTFTSEFFFADMTPQQAEQWKSLRHDSGDPFEFGDRVIAFYEELGIDPLAKSIVFSDGLDIDHIIELADYFKGKINIMFGWGTTLTNDLGVTPNNIVMKAVAVNGVSTVKLSDNEGKHTGDPEKIEVYTLEKDRRIGRAALRETVRL
jgi:nicotinate phosphoribosyltransferase